MNKSECLIENKLRDRIWAQRKVKASSERRVAVSCRRRELPGWFTQKTSMCHQVLLMSKAGLQTHACACLYQAVITLLETLVVARAQYTFVVPFPTGVVLFFR